MESGEEYCGIIVEGELENTEIFSYANKEKTSVNSSSRPEKPPSCSSDVWDSLFQIITDSWNDNTNNQAVALSSTSQASQGRISPTKLSQSNRIILEITDIDEVGEEVTKVVQEQEKDVTLPDFEEDKENVQNDGKINENGFEKKNTRKMLTYTNNWKQNIRIQKCLHGQEHINRNGNLTGKKSQKRKEIT
ncbi:hypothetical protein JTB14_038080 [Gonioctena quinquepunctata]|nr:hypothetical protein JTB14_038080 [Gonioctena quinquepunctata]